MFQLFMSIVFAIMLCIFANDSYSLMVNAHSKIAIFLFVMYVIGATFNIMNVIMTSIKLYKDGKF
jgi:hypothetical protein